MSRQYHTHKNSKQQYYPNRADRPTSPMGNQVKTNSDETEIPSTNSNSSYNYPSYISNSSYNSSPYNSNQTSSYSSYNSSSPYNSNNNNNIGYAPSPYSNSSPSYTSNSYNSSSSSSSYNSNSSSSYNSNSSSSYNSNSSSSYNSSSSSSYNSNSSTSFNSNPYKVQLYAPIPEQSSVVQINIDPNNPNDIFEDTILLLNKLKNTILDGQQELNRLENKDVNLKSTYDELTNLKIQGESKLESLIKTTEEFSKRWKELLEGDYISYSARQIEEVHSSLSLAHQNLCYLQISLDQTKNKKSQQILFEPDVDVEIPENLPGSSISPYMISSKLTKISSSNPKDIVLKLSENITTITETFELFSVKTDLLKNNIEKLENDINQTKSTLKVTNENITKKEQELQQLKKQLTIFDKNYSQNFTKEEVIELISKVNTAIRKVTMAEAVQLLKSQQLSSNDETLCIVCYERPRNIRFSPCGHGTTCDTCSNVLSKCPTCRLPIEQKQKLFL